MRLASDSVFSGAQADLLDKYSAEDRYIGSLVGVRFAESFRSRAPLLVDLPTAFQPARFGEAGAQSASVVKTT